MLRLLIISTSSSTGGAAIAAHRLMDALNRSGEVEAKMLVRDKNTVDDNVLTIGNPLCTKLKFVFERGVIWMCNRFSKKHLFEVSIANTGYDITRTDAFKQADVIHLHWTQQGMLSMRDMEKIFSSGKPVVCTMHDMWACTGICHHAEDCSGYQKDCRHCPKIKDCLAHQTFAAKQNLYQHPIDIIACSHWLESKAKSSALLRNKQIHCIANALDTEVFRPADKIKVRQTLSLPLEKPLILFASQKVTDKRKGIDYLVKAADQLKMHGREVEFIVMGNHSEQIGALLPYPVHSLGYVSSTEKAAMIYQAADMFVTPSLMENLPNTIAESLSCGTPCVGFNIGGIPEMIDHKVNGYVARYKDADDLATGIEWVLDCQNKAVLRKAAAGKACNCYSESVIAQQHIDLYKRLLSK